MSLEILSADVLEPGRPSLDPTTHEIPTPMTEAAFKSEFLRVMQARGYIHQISHPEELDAAAAGGVVTAYVGFDATAPASTWAT